VRIAVALTMIVGVGGVRRVFGMFRVFKNRFHEKASPPA
jgi:hypothetical protein